MVYFLDVRQGIIKVFAKDNTVYPKLNANLVLLSLSMSRGKETL